MDGVIEHVDETRRREAELAGFEDEALGRAFMKSRCAQLSCMGTWRMSLVWMK
jgi:hypothetical protein